MEPISEFLRLNEDAKFAALTHLYLELKLPLAQALQAADADLSHLDDNRPVAEAA
jgi:hypothetical protein